MGLYIEKRNFYKYIQNHFNLNESNELFDSYDKVIIKLNRLYNNYEEEKLKLLKNTRWI